MAVAEAGRDGESVREREEGIRLFEGGEEVGEGGEGEGEGGREVEGEVEGRLTGQGGQL